MNCTTFTEPYWIEFEIAGHVSFGSIKIYVVSAFTYGRPIDRLFVSVGKAFDDCDDDFLRKIIIAFHHSVRGGRIPCGAHDGLPISAAWAGRSAMNTSAAIMASFIVAPGVARRVVVGERPALLAVLLDAKENS